MQPPLHLRHRLLMARVLDEVNGLVGIGVIIVKFRALSALVPFGVTVAFGADGAADDFGPAFGREGGFVPRLAGILEQRHEAFAFALRRWGQTAKHRQRGTKTRPLAAARRSGAGSGAGRNYNGRPGSR